MRSSRCLFALVLLCCFWALSAAGAQGSGGTASQTIQFMPIADRPVDAAPFQVVAVSSAYLPVTLTVSGPATLSGPGNLNNRLLTLTGPGAVIVTATQAGNTQYAPASAQLTFQSQPIQPSITWSPPSLVYGTPVTSAMLAAAATAPPIVNSTADIPTITTQVGSSLLGIATPTYSQASGMFTYLGSKVGPTSDPNSYGGYMSTSLQLPYALTFAIGFTCDCQQFEFVMQARNGHFRVWVDGSYTTDDATPFADAFPAIEYVLVKFPDKRLRQIQLTDAANAPFFGVSTSDGDTIAPYQAPVGPRVMLFGDSWTAPTVLPPAIGPAQPGQDYGSGYPQILGQLFHWNFYFDGVGGSGFTNAGTDLLGRTFVQRAQGDICTDSFEGVLLMGGTNDGGQPQSVLQPAVDQTLSEILACQPGQPLYLYGPQGYQPPIDQSMAAAVAAIDSPDITYTDMGQLGWFYGSSTDPSTGNNYLYLNGHPTPIGHDFLAQEIAMDLVAKYPQLLPKPYFLSSPVPVDGTFTYSVAPGALLPAGSNTVAATFTPADTTNYTAATASSTIPVAQATTTTTLAASQAAGNLALQANVAPQYAGVPTGSVVFQSGGRSLGAATLAQGIASLTLPASQLPPGSDTVTASYGGDSNFLASVSTGSFTITNAIPDFSFQLGAQQITVLPGQSVPVTAAATAVGGLTGPLTAACSGLPAGATCMLAPAQFSASQAAVVATLTIQAYVPVAPVQTASGGGLPGAASRFAAGTLLCGLALLPCSRRRGAAFGAFTALAVSVVIPLAATGCGSRSTTIDATPGTYLVQVALTGGSPAITHTQPLTVVIP